MESSQPTFISWFCYTGASSFCVSVSLSVKWWKRFCFLQMPSVRDLWELVWKGTSSGQMVNKLCPFRIILSNPSLLLHCKMQGCTHSRLNWVRECYLGEAASRSCTELSSLLISGSLWIPSASHLTQAAPISIIMRSLTSASHQKLCF